MFSDKLNTFQWEEVLTSITRVREHEVQTIFNSSIGKISVLEKFLTLISPAAFPFLNEMLQLSQRITQER